MTGSGKLNCLGTITVTTNSHRDRSTTGENNLVLFTVATRLHAIIGEDTNNQICQGKMENDSYLDVNIRNLIVIDDQMIEAGKDNRIVNLFTKGSLLTLCKICSIKEKATEASA